MRKLFLLLIILFSYSCSNQPIDIEADNELEELGTLSEPKDLKSLVLSYKDNFKQDLKRQSFVDSLNTVVKAGHYSATKPVYKVSAYGKAMTKKNEGCCLKSYLDGENRSIGYGHYFPKGTKVPKKITQAQAEAYFESDVKIIENRINDLFNNQIDTRGYVVPQCFIDGLADFMYNCGTKSIDDMQFLARIKDSTRWNRPACVEKDLCYSARFLRDRYITAKCRQKDGSLIRKKLPALRKRRNQESDLMQTKFKYLLYEK